MKEKSKLSDKVRFWLSRVRRRSQATEEVEEVKKPIEWKIVIINIKFRDGSQLQYTQKYKKDQQNITYIRCYYGLYKWFFFRESEWYSFEHKSGTKIINRNDILRIEFDYKYEVENFA